MNKRINFPIHIFVLILSFQLTVNAQTDKRLDSIAGVYVVDLRPTPNSEAYMQEFVVSGWDKNSFNGSFYGAEIKDGLINRKFKNTFLAFTTEDRTNTYYHFVKILSDRIEGLTYSSDRALIQPWTGLKKE